MDVIPTIKIRTYLSSAEKKASGSTTSPRPNKPPVSFSSTPRSFSSIAGGKNKFGSATT
ncbi:unnamed protein product, partial [Amoebophrya sp. A120]|eukprot:GSA120T00023183001.1